MKKHNAAPRTLAAKGGALLLLAGALALPPAAATARIDIVTVPSRDRTELTIYNAVDLTLVRERRDLTFTEGSNEIQFSWANTLIDPTSLHLDLLGAGGLTLHDAVYPTGTREMIVWDVEAAEDTAATVEITYFVSGLSWGANYTAIANAGETHLQLQQFTKVDNKSGEDFSRASTRVIVGDVRLLRTIAALARISVQTGVLLLDGRGGFRAFGSVADADQTVSPGDVWRVRNGREGVATRREVAAEIFRQAVSELHVMAVEGEEDIRDQWAKQLPSPVVDGIPFNLSYEYDTRRFGPEPVKFYKFRNVTDNEIGEDPFPEGPWYVYSHDGRDGLRIEGRTEHEYIPIGEEAELELGSDGLLTVEERTVSITRANFRYDSNGDVESWEEDHEVLLEIRNARGREVPFRLTHYLAPPWEFRSVSDDGYDRVDRETVRWDLLLTPMETRSIKFTVRHQRNRGDAPIPLPANTGLRR